MQTKLVQSDQYNFRSVMLLLLPSANPFTMKYLVYQVAQWMTAIECFLICSNGEMNT